MAVFALGLYRVESAARKFQKPRSSVAELSLLPVNVPRLLQFSICLAQQTLLAVSLSNRLLLPPVG